MTKPRAEQLRLRSTRTGDHILDLYLEAAEMGNRTLADLLADIFDTDTGIFRGDLFDFRIQAGTNSFQFRVGDFPDSTSGWQDTGDYLFRARGEHTNATDYKRFDIVSYGGEPYMAKADHKSTSAAPGANFMKITDMATVFTPERILNDLKTVDGPGSGVDADLLDGQHGSYYAPISNPTINGWLSVNGLAGAFVGMSLFRAGSERWAITMKNDGEAAGDVGSSLALNAYTNAGAWKSEIFTVNRSTGRLTFTFDPYVNTNKIWHAGNDGPLSGLDADTLDGQHGAYYLPASSYTAADVLAKLLTVDGPGTSLDADSVDGYHGYSMVPTPTNTTADDWNSYIAPGWANRLLHGTVNANGPGVAQYFYVLTTQYAAARRLQIAYPYTLAGTTDGRDSIWMRYQTVSTDTWSGWYEVPSKTRNDALYVSVASYTAADVLAKLLTVDGAGSGLDADSVDGIAGADILAYNGELGASVDLNTLVTPGWWSQGSNAEAAGGANYPSIYAGRLAVYANPAASMVWQVYHEYAQQNRAFFRGRYSGVWSAWKQVAYADEVVANNGSTWTPHASSKREAGWNYFYTDFGYIQLGPANTSFAHIYTDRPEFYFNKPLLVNGSLVWNAGNDGSGSGLDADTVDGVHASASVVGSTVAVRTSGGHLLAELFNSSAAVATRSSETVFFSSTDDYIRKNNKAGMKASLGFVELSDLVYTGSTQDQLTFPVGHHVFIDSGGTTAMRNAASAIYLNAGGWGYVLTASGTALSGTWRKRGGIQAGTDSGALYQRTA